MLKKYKMISIIYGGSGTGYAQALNDLICRQAEKHRYPLSSMIVMDKILTGDLMNSVVKLFQDSELCVALLTADDCCIKDKTQVMRLRQNVVFELGMALFRLGEERCILLSDFDPASPNFELPSDLKGIDIKPFSADNQSEVFQDVLNKILQLSKSSVNSGNFEITIPQYDHLLDRNEYFVDYEELFASYQELTALEGNRYLEAALKAWQNECGSFIHYEEKCLYFFERIGFIPIFGRHQWVIDWCENCEKLLSKYNPNDIAYCGRKRLNFLQNLAYTVSAYTKLKLQKDFTPGFSDYYELLQQLIMLPFDSSDIKNPLVAILYYDYLGLIYHRLYDASSDPVYLEKAIGCFELLINEYIDRVDMNLNIWTGFLSYNLARCFLKMYRVTQEHTYINSALTQFSIATRERKKWLKQSCFNSTVRSALSYEYFISKIEWTNTSRELGEKPAPIIREEYKHIEGELESYFSKDEQLERLRFVQQMLKKYQEELA